MIWLQLVLTVLGAYLVGSIPTGYLVARGKGLDIRAVGSGNIGATNVFRILGKPAGIFVLLVDALKGCAGCALVPWLIRQGWSASSPNPEWIRVAAGVSAVLGHNYTCWLRFKGGKGIATSAGVLLALMPSALLTVLAVWIAAAVTTRFVSVASIAAAIVLPVAAWFYGRSPLLIGLALLLSVMAIYKHRSNIQRLLNGTEPRIGARKAPAPVA